MPVGSDLAQTPFIFVHKLTQAIVYAIEATCHAPSFEGIYSEIYKVLKPGGTVSSLCPHHVLLNTDSSVCTSGA